MGGERVASSLAFEYLSFCEKYPPPSPLYIRKHFRWIFRNILEPKKPLLTSEDWQNTINDPENGWKLKMWTFLNRPYLVSIAQFKDICRLYEFKLGISTNKKRQAIDEAPTFRSIRKKRAKIEWREMGVCVCVLEKNDWSVWYLNKGILKKIILIMFFF